MYPQAKQIAQTFDNVGSIVIIQADNPDADSLGSALAMEQILAEQGKETFLYCGVDMPGYLRYLNGWDRVNSKLPNKFDASIIVDASTMTLLDKPVQAGYEGWLASKPCIVLDHHATVENPIPFATVVINDPGRSSAGEVIYHLSKQLGWALPLQAQEMIMSSILGDTQGLSNSLASAETYRVMAEFVDNGVDRPALEELRREFGKMPPEIYKYKAALIQRTRLDADGQIASVVIPQNEISQYSPLYNPAPLIQGDMLQTSGVRLAIVFKHYADGKTTAAIRSNHSAAIAGHLAEHMGGGGHAFASGFKIENGRTLDDITGDCLNYAGELLAKLNQDAIS